MTPGNPLHRMRGINAQSDYRNAGLQWRDNNPPCVELSAYSKPWRFRVIISDNPSTGATPRICLAYAARDSRVRYIRHATNLGEATNFRVVLSEADTPYFMWAVSCIMRQLEVLGGDSGMVLSQSRVLFTANGRPVNSSNGFQTLADITIEHTMPEFYDPSAASGVPWNDHVLGVTWPVAEPTLPDRGQTYPNPRT